MWSGWAVALAARLPAARPGRSVDGPLFAMLGFDAGDRAVRHGGGLAATPMARLRERDARPCSRRAWPRARRGRAVRWPAAWHAPDPVGLRSPARPTSPALFGRPSRCRSPHRHRDQRRPRAHSTDAGGARRRRRWSTPLVCADDGLAVKPAADMVVHLCDALAVQPARTAVVGDSTADLRMGRAAGAGLVVGVLTGVGRLDDLAPHADAVIESVAELTSRATVPAVNQNAGVRRTPASCWRSRPSCGRP